MEEILGNLLFYGKEIILGRGKFLKNGCLGDQKKKAGCVTLSLRKEWVNKIGARKYIIDI
jgi:hypothetical protein